MEIQNNSLAKGDISKEGEAFIFRYKSEKITENKDLELVVRGNNISMFSVTPTCGCTVPIVNTIDDNTVAFKIQVNVGTQQTFSKVLKLNYKENNEQKRNELILKGL